MEMLKRQKRICVSYGALVPKGSFKSTSKVGLRNSNYQGLAGRSVSDVETLFD
jgi:hypothetical protein